MNELLASKFTSEAIRNFFVEKPMPVTLGEEFVPVSSERVFDESLTYFMNADNMPIDAKIIAQDSETPIMGRAVGEKATFDMLKLGVQRHITEKIMRALQNPRNQSEQDAQIRAIFNDMQLNREGILSRIERMRWQAAVDGVITMQQDGMIAQVDYARDPSTIFDFSATPWDDDTNSNPIANLMDVAAAMVDATGVAVTRAVTSTAVISFLLRNPNLIQWVTGTTTAKMLTLTELNNYMASMELPLFLAYDAKGRIEQKNGGYYDARYMPAAKILLLPDQPIGETVFGYTGEELRSPTLAGAEGQQITDVGIFSYVYTQDEPIAQFTKSVAMALPSMAGLNLSAVMTVLSPTWQAAHPDSVPSKGTGVILPK